VILKCYWACYSVTPDFEMSTRYTLDFLAPDIYVNKLILVTVFRALQPVDSWCTRGSLYLIMKFPQTNRLSNNFQGLIFVTIFGALHPLAHGACGVVSILLSNPPLSNSFWGSSILRLTFHAVYSQSYYQIPQTDCQFLCMGTRFFLLV
jgi:hypothetical protein